METIADLVADARERDGPLVSTPGGPTDHTYEALATTAWKAGNLLRHYGVRPGDSVAVVVGPAEPDAKDEPDAADEPSEGDEPGSLGTTPTPITAVLGGLIAGASVTLDPVEAVSATALVAPTAWLDRYTPGPGTKPIGYGSEATEPTVAQFEREAWSENPVAPPVDLDPTTTAFGGSRPLAHGDLLAESRRVVDEYSLESVDRVGIFAPLTPGAFVAGVLAPMTVGATIVLAEEDDRDDLDDLDVVVSEDATDPGIVTTIDPTRLFDGRV